ncbi:hypothetical protein FQR65_LT17043 [Abscondita terminalis]|nr:hypothetical protein FQR65_LT17043 [Abscondita terminalis]
MNGLLSFYDDDIEAQAPSTTIIIERNDISNIEEPISVELQPQLQENTPLENFVEVVEPTSVELPMRASKPNKGKRKATTKEKWSALAAAKLDLVKLQMKCIQQEHQLKLKQLQKEHKLRTLSLQLDIRRKRTLLQKVHK